MTPEETLARRVAGIEADHTSGASALALQAVDVLDDALGFGRSAVERTGRALCRAQPTMAPIWNAAALALGANGRASLQRLRVRMLRAPGAMSTVLTRLVMADRRASADSTISLATVSQSGSVRGCLVGLAEHAELRVICAEGRPMFEGRLMAASLAEAGIAVTFCTDAAVGSVVREAAAKMEAVVVGADAVTPGWFVNKCGTLGLVAAAASGGIPVYVVASQASFIHPILSAALKRHSGPEDEVWDGPPDGVDVVNPYFEEIPMDQVSMLVTEAGAIGPASVLQVCHSLVDTPSAERAVGVLTHT